MSTPNTSTNSNSQSNDSEFVVVNGIIQVRDNERPRPSILSVHGTAISHASSTPMVGHQQNQMQELIDSNLSTIFLTPQPPRRRSRSSSKSDQVVGSSTDRHHSIQSYASDYSDDSFNETPRKRQNRNQHPYREWHSFKPKNENSLYYVIVHHPNNMNEHVENWIRLHQNDSNVAIYRLLQFFVDICGFESTDVSTYYNMDYNYQNLKLSILQNIPMLQKVTMAYLFKFKTGWAAEKQSYVYDFIEKLIDALGKTNTLFDYHFLKHILYLFLFFIGSDLKSTVSTCGYIVSKMYTVSKKIEANIVMNLKNSNWSNEDRETLEIKKNVMSTFVNSLLDILKKCLQKTDSSLREMFAAAMDEMKIWLKIEVSVIASDLNTYLFLISKVACNPSGKLRKAAISTCKEFVNVDNLNQVLDESLQKNLIEIISGRVVDISNEVALAAIDICTEIVKRGQKLIIPTANKAKIWFLLYDTPYSLAFSAGRFYSEMISYSRDQSCGTLFIIQNILNMHKEMMDKLQKTGSFLVEALLPHVPELKDWDFMVNLLLQPDVLVHNEEIILVELFCESIKQILTGKGPRMTSSIEKTDNCKALNAFLGGFVALKIKYGTNLNCLRQFYSVLTEINFKDLTLNRFRDHMRDVLKESKTLFLICNDEVILKEISRYFFLVTDPLSPFCDQSLGSINNITESITHASTLYLKEVDENEIVNEEDIHRIEHCFLKLQMLYYYHNLSDLMNFSFMLNRAVKLEENATTKTRTYIFKCCLLHLSHKLNAIIDSKYTEQLTNSMVELKASLDEFIQNCFTVLTTTKILPLKYTIFQYLCEMYLHFNQSIYSVLDQKPHLSALILEPIQTPSFMVLAQDYFFKSEDNFTLDERRIHFINVLKMGFCNGLHILEYVKLYQYYATHYDDYGDLINQHIMQLSDEKIVPAVMILHTIKYSYGNISPEDSDANRNLMILSCHFQKLLSNRPQETLLLVQLGLRFMITCAADRYAMLKFMKPFFILLYRRERIRMADYVLSLVPEADKLNVHIVDCIEFLKARKCKIDYSFASTVDDGTDSDSTHSGASNRIESFSEDE